MRNFMDILTGKSARAERPAPVPVHRVTRRRPGGRKVWKMLNAQGYEVMTPWAAKERRRRRAAGKVSKQARKVNRAVRSTGGLR